MTKKKIVIIGSAILVSISSILGVALMTAKKPSEKVVDAFLTTLIQDKDYIKAYDYLDVPKEIIRSEIALDNTLNDLGLSIDNIKSYDLDLVKNKEKKEVKVIVNTIDKENTKHKSELTVKDNKISVPYKTDYEIKVPAGSQVKINEVELDKNLSTKVQNQKVLSFELETSSKERTKDEISIPIYLDYYKSLCLLDTNVNIKIVNNQGLNIDEKVNLNKNYIVTDFKVSDETANVFGEATKIVLCSVIDNVINQKEFSEIEKLISSNSSNIDKIKNAYEDLKTAFKGIDDNGITVTFSDYKLVDILMNDVYVVDNNKIAGLIQYNLEYKENRTIDTATISEDKQAQKIGIVTFEVCEDGTLLLDNSQGIFSLHL